MKWEVSEGDATNTVSVKQTTEQDWLVAVDDESAQDVRIRPAGVNRYILEVGGERHLLNAKIRDGIAYVQCEGWNLRLKLDDPRDHFMGGADTATQGQITTQMPGVVVRTLISVGDSVQKGQALIVVEAMKMENELKAPMDGVVVAVHVQDGQAVDSGTLLIEVSEPADET